MQDIMIFGSKKIKNWIKFSKTIPKNKIWTSKLIIQHLLFGVVYLLISDFLVDSQSQQKLATKVFHTTIVFVGLMGQTTTLYARDPQLIQTLLWSLEFVIQLKLKHDTSTTQFLSKNFILQTSPHSALPTPATQLKSSLTLQIFQKTCLSLVSNKTLALHHFYSPKNCIFKALGKQMSIYSCKSP